MSDSNIHEKLSTKILNAGTALQHSDRFRVRFLGIPENLSDFLSRQVRSVTPRTITFGTGMHTNRRAQFRDIGKIEIEPLTIMLLHDDAGIVDSILMAQVMRQKGKDVSGFPQINGNSNNSKFNVKLEWIDINGNVSRYETYKNCYITTITPADLTANDDMPSISTLIMNFDDVDYSFEDEVFALTS